MDYSLRKNKNLNQGTNPYQDKYTGFTWDSVHSSHYNCFIENTGHLDFQPAPDFSNNFISPQFQTRTYYTGTQNGSKKITLNLVFVGLTLHELNAAMHWLDRRKIADLYFDYSPFWKYTCKLSAIGTMEKYVYGKICLAHPNGSRIDTKHTYADTYLCKVSVTFETVFESEAIAAYSTVGLTSGKRDMLEIEVNQENYPDDMDPELIDSSILYEKYQFQDETPNIPNDIITITKTNHTYNIIIYNPFSIAAPFKIFLDKVHKSVRISEDVYEFRGNQWKQVGNTRQLMYTQLRLDDNEYLNLDYNSDDGTVLCGGQLIESLQNDAAQPVCVFKQGLANVKVPGAIDDVTCSRLGLKIEFDEESDPNLCIVYDGRQYMV